MSKERISISFSGTSLLAVAFIVLKLCNVIDWSWWWVTAPLWIPLGLVVMILIVTSLEIIAKEIKRKKQ